MGLNASGKAIRQERCKRLIPRQHLAQILERLAPLSTGPGMTIRNLPQGIEGKLPNHALKP